MPKRVILASDRLPARDNGPWALDKLSFIDEFVPPALKATRRKKQRYYVDLFAGPGLNVNDEGGGAEFEGSSLRALAATAYEEPDVFFTDAILVNKSQADHDALQERVRRYAATGAIHTPLSRIEMLRADANQVIHRTMRSIPLRAYAFIMADIEAPKQLPWSTVTAIKQYGHESVDFFLLFPLDMALRRMLSYRQETVEQSADVLTRFFGSDDWRELLQSRVTNAQSGQLARGLVDLYQSRMRALGWAHVLVVRDVKRVGDCGLYKMLYATNHDAGGRIAKWSADDPRRSGQLNIF